MRLHELQRSFQDRVLRYKAGIEAQLEGVAAEDFEARLGAYVDGYRTRLTEALAAAYPVLSTTLGRAEFEREMRGYIDGTDSHHFSVRQYGADLASRLQVGRSAAFGLALSELARWEWTLADVFDALDDEPLEVQELAAVAPALWPTLCFSLRACVRRFESQTNAIEWWRAANGLVARPSELTATQPAQWLIWRRGVTTLFRSLDSREADMLDQARDGATFGLMCEHMASAVGAAESPQRTASLLRGWLAEQIIRDYKLQEVGP
ncbi:MAG: hypothetical protein NVS3B5_15010 [Sphingomicrobium sp.]